MGLLVGISTLRRQETGSPDVSLPVIPSGLEIKTWEAQARDVVGGEAHWAPRQLTGREPRGERAERGNLQARLLTFFMLDFSFSFSFVHHQLKSPKRAETHPCQIALPHADIVNSDKYKSLALHAEVKLSEALERCSRLSPPSYSDGDQAPSKLRTAGDKDRAYR